MKILQFIYTLGQGGAERFVVDLANELAKNSELKLYTLRDGNLENQDFFVSELSDKITYINLRINPGFKPHLIWTFYNILKTEHPEVVHCHLNLVIYFFISSIIFHKKMRFINTIHTSAEKEVSTRFERMIRRFIYKHDFFTPVAISDETKNSFISYYGLNDIPVIYNGRSFIGKTVDYQNVVKEIATIKPSIETLVFCHVARYNKLKNQQMLISVFNRLHEVGYDLILLVIGEGFENADELKRTIAFNHIHFLGIKSNVSDYLYASDAFCLSSLYEGMPISLIEAFACGCVPICTPVGGIINTIENGVTGFLSKTISEDDYFEAITKFINYKDSINREKLVTYYHENFSIEHCAAEYMRIYTEK
jgi:glycosyltransferase involved in cell wall biosynthesis